MQNYACTRLDKEKITNREGSHELKLAVDVLYGLVVVLMLKLNFSQLQVSQLQLQLLQVLLFSSQSFFDFFKSFTAVIGPVYYLQLTSYLVF